MVEGKIVGRTRHRVVDSAGLHLADTVTAAARRCHPSPLQGVLHDVHRHLHLRPWRVR
jgi:hypothetical protein